MENDLIIVYTFSLYSPYIPGQVLLMTDSGELSIYHQKLKVVVIRVAMDMERLSPCMCMFGAHPQHVLWVEAGRLYSTDLRTAEARTQRTFYNDLSCLSLWFWLSLAAIMFGPATCASGEWRCG